MYKRKGKKKPKVYPPKRQTSFVHMYQFPFRNVPHIFLILVTCNGVKP